MSDPVYALAVSSGPAGPGVWLAGRASGLYCTRDAGGSWQHVNELLALTAELPAMAVAISPSFQEDKTLLAGVPGGVLRSRDAGASWQIVLFPTPPPVISAMALSPCFAEDGVTLAGAVEDGVFRSGDGGRHWERWNFGLLDTNVYALAMSPGFCEDETVLAATETGIFRSTNGGRAWRETDFPMEQAPVLSLAISPGFLQDGVVFGGTEACGLFVSTDHGQTWDRLAMEGVDGPINFALLHPQYSAQPEILVLAGTRLYLSRDGGRQWSIFQVDGKSSSEITAVAAQYGPDAQWRMLVGFENGEVLSTVRVEASHD